MKILKYRLLQIGAVLLLCAMLAASVAVPLLAADQADGSSLHYGVSGMRNNEMKVVELLSALYGIDATDAERAYLNSFGETTFSYNTNVPEDGITKIYDGEAGTLDIHLEPYSFTAVNGTTVTWTPVRARIGTQTCDVALLNGVYACRFTDLFHSDDFEMEVDFVWSVDLPEDAVKHLPNAAFSVGREALDVLNAYDAAYEAYTSAKQKRETWVAYEAAVAAFDRYQAELKKYNEEDKPEYDQYVIDHNVYLDQLARWQAWENYWAATKFYTVKDENGNTGYDRWLAYDAYLTELNKVKKQLAPMELLFISDSRGWQVYASTMGDTVTRVLTSCRDELRKHGLEDVAKEVDEEIDAADAATRALRPLLAEYAALRKASYGTEHEKYQALYAFYIQHYEAINKNFYDLRWSLYEICLSGFFATASAVPGVKELVVPKIPHLYQYIAQLYVISTCLDDAESQNSAWQINKYNTLSTLLEEVHRLSDTHAANPTLPTAPTLPQTAPEAIDYVAPAEAPDFPQVSKPTPPPVVDEPPIPDPVDEPEAYPNEKPDWWDAPEPPDEPDAPKMDPLVRALADEVKQGTLTERTNVGKPRTLTFTQTVNCPISISNRMTVTFYGMQNQILDQQQVEYGTEVIYGGPSTRVPTDERNHYEFVAWVYADGTVANLLSITKNLSVYAKYRVTPVIYTVSWVLDGVTYQSQHTYGQDPVCPVIPAKQATRRETYTFDGWDRELTPVVENTTYTGSFTATPIPYTVTWKVGEETVTENYFFGEIPSYKGSTQRAADSYRYEFIGWDVTPREVSDHVTYTARFRATPLVLSNDGTVQSVLHTAERITVQAQASAVNVEQAVAYARETGKVLTVTWNEVSVTLDGAALDAIAASTCQKLSWSVENTDDGEIFRLRYLSSAGRALDLPIEATLRANDGVEGSFYLADENGDWSLLPTENGDVTLVGQATLMRRTSHTIFIDVTEHCNFNALQDRAMVGETVSLNLPCSFGYEVISATVTLADGTQVPVEDLTFVMPAGDVTVSVTVAQIVYHVSFVVDGTVISEEDYLMGEEILLPTDPTKPDDAEYRYNFVGWSPSVKTVASGKERDLVYTANFSAVNLVEESPFEQSFFESFYFIISMYALGFAAAVAGVILLIRFRKPLWKLAKRLFNGKNKDAAPSLEDAAPSLEEETTSDDPQA